MSTPAKPSGRVLVALNLPEYKVPLLVTMARAIVQRMTENPWFPAPDPSLADVQAAIDDLEAAETTARSRVTGGVESREARRRVLVERLQYLQDHVQAIANANPQSAAAIIESAGMHVKRVGKPPPPVYRARAGRVSGEVDLFVPSAGERAGYEHQLSLDGGKTWLPSPQPFTNNTRVTVTGLTPGTTVWFRYRWTFKGATGDWSQPISIMVV
jgi:hypothetical protein